MLVIVEIRCQEGLLRKMREREFHGRSNPVGMENHLRNQRERFLFMWTGALV